MVSVELIINSASPAQSIKRGVPNGGTSVALQIPSDFVTLPELNLSIDLFQGEDDVPVAVGPFTFAVTPTRIKSVKVTQDGNPGPFLPDKPLDVTIAFAPPFKSAVASVSVSDQTAATVPATSDTQAVVQILSDFVIES